MLDAMDLIAAIRATKTEGELAGVWKGCRSYRAEIALLERVRLIEETISKIFNLSMDDGK